MPSWLEWGFWASPFSYSEIGITVNEFLAPRWQKVCFSDPICNLLWMNTTTNRRHFYFLTNIISCYLFRFHLLTLLLGIERLSVEGLTLMNTFTGYQWVLYLDLQYFLMLDLLLLWHSWTVSSRPFIIGSYFCLIFFKVISFYNLLQIWNYFVVWITAPNASSAIISSDKLRELQGEGNTSNVYLQKQSFSEYSNAEKIPKTSGEKEKLWPRELLVLYKLKTDIHISFREDDFTISTT